MAACPGFPTKMLQVANARFPSWPTDNSDAGYFHYTSHADSAPAKNPTKIAGKPLRETKPAQV